MNDMMFSAEALFFLCNLVAGAIDVGVSWVCRDHVTQLVHFW